MIERSETQANRTNLKPQQPFERFRAKRARVRGRVRVDKLLMAAQRHGVRALLSAHVTRNRFGLAPLDVAAQTLDVLEPYFAVFALGL